MLLLNHIKSKVNKSKSFVSSQKERLLMRILWITMESILPSNSGGRLGVFKRLEQIAKTEEIYLFYSYDYRHELSYVDDLKKYCREVYPYYRKKNLIHALLHIVKYPFTVASRDIPKMQRDIVTCIENHDVQVINVDFPHMCVNLLPLKIPIPIILNEHNIEWKLYKNIAKSQRNIMKRILYEVDSFRLKRYETMITNKMDISLFTFVSEKDMSYMELEGSVNKLKSKLIPVGADVRTCVVDNKDSIQKRDGDKIILFVGKMSYGPNIEAVIWFSNKILPKILNDIPDCKFYIVGKDPDDVVQKLSGDHIVVTGEVESVDEYYIKADIVVLPLLNGGGVKVKLLEAISFNKIVISTSIGVEGTIYTDGESIAVSDDVYEFSCLCITALKYPSTYFEKSKRAYNIFETYYTWESIGETYRNAIKSLVNCND